MVFFLFVDIRKQLAHIPKKSLKCIQKLMNLHFFWNFYCSKYPFSAHFTYFSWVKDVSCFFFSSSAFNLKNPFFFSFLPLPTNENMKNFANELPRPIQFEPDRMLPRLNFFYSAKKKLPFIFVPITKTDFNIPCNFKICALKEREKRKKRFNFFP